MNPQSLLYLPIDLLRRLPKDADIRPVAKSIERTLATAVTLAVIVCSTVVALLPLLAPK